MRIRTRMLGRKIWLMVVLVLFLPQMGFAQNNNHLQAVTLQLPWPHQFEFAGYYAALEQGYYHDAGLDVTITDGYPGICSVDEILHGRAQYGVAQSELLLHRLKGEPVVVLAAVFQHSAAIFLARQDSGIATPQDMVGRKVMLRPGYDAVEQKATLLNAGVNLDRVGIIPSSFDVFDLVIGKTDVFNGSINDDPFSLKEHKMEASIIRPRDYGVDFYGDTLFTSELEIAKHPKEVKAFHGASLKGWRYALAHSDDVVTLLKEKYGVQKSFDHLRFEAEAIRDLVNVQLVELGHMDLGRWQDMADTYVRLDMVEPGYSLEGFIYDPDSQPEYPRLSMFFYALLAILGVVAVILFVLYFFNRRLNRMLHETQEALSKKEKLYRFLFDNAPVGIALTDEDGTVREMNNEAVAATGYDRADANRMKASDIYCNPEDRQQLVALVKKDGVAKGLDIRLQRRDGNPLDVRMTSVGLVVDERPHMLSMFEDVSKAKEMERERIKMEASLSRMQKMEAIGLMAGGVAHDLNNILCGIVSYPELILMQLPEDSPWRKSVMEIHKSGQRAAAVVADLLTVARGVASVKEPHNINKLLTEYLESPECRQLKVLYGNVGCSISLEPDLANIACSPIHIKKCFMNLVTNAAEAIVGEGCVDISTRNEIIADGDKDSHGLIPGEYVVVSVSDTGPGIPEKDKDHIFEPFYTKKVMGRSGTGLGLAVVWNTMQDHNGAIGVQSSEKGTVFELYFPACHGRCVAEIQASSLKQLEGDGETILIIDDEPQQRDIASQILESLGYKFHAVNSGEDAIEYLRDNKADLLLLDMVMDPGMNGRETYDEILKSHPGQKALICSGFSLNGEVKRALQLGAGGFVKKPYTRNQLGLAVQQELAH